MSIYDQIAQLGAGFDPVGNYMQGRQWKQQNELAKMQMAQAQQEQETKNQLLQLRNQLAVSSPESRGQIMAQMFAADPAQGKMAREFYTATSPKVFNMTPGGALIDQSGKVLYRNTFKEEPAQATAVGGGLPQVTGNPFAGFNDPKKADDLRKFYAEQGYKQVQDMATDAATAKGVIGDVDRFLKLNETNYTGAAADLPVIGSMRAGFDQDFAEMRSISDKLTPAMRQGLPGAASDRDIRMFANATVGVGKPKEANANVGLGLKVAAQNRIDRAQFMDAYYTENTSLIGAEQAWQKYIDANPIFDPEAPDGSYKLNKARQSWQQFFGPEQPSHAPSNKAPKPGTVQDGYVFLGGDPSDPKSWKVTKR